MKAACCLVFLFLSIAFPALPQTRPVYRNLVMEGGGLRGIAYGGALSELEKQGVLPQIKRVGGTSAGAIQALLLAIGYNPDQITQLTFETDIRKFADGRFFFFGGFSRTMRQYGWYRGEKFSDWLGSLIKAKTGNADITLGQLHELSLRQNFRDLYVTGTNLSKQQAVVFSYETYPNMKVRDAVRISMSIPLFYQAVAIDSTGKVLPLKKYTQHLDIMVDGGIVANFPIHMFDDKRFLPAGTRVPENGMLFNPETLGLRLDRSEQILYDQQQQGLAPYSISRFNDYMGAFYNIVLENLNRSTLKPEDWARTISINTLQFAPKLNFSKMSTTEKDQLLESGHRAVKDFLKPGS